MILFAVYSQTSWFRENVRTLILKTAKSELRGELHIGKISGNFFTGLEFQDVVLQESGHELFSADRVEARYDPTGFLFGRYAFPRVRLVNAAIHLVRSNDGTWNAERLLKPTPKDTLPSTLVLSINQLQFVNCSLMLIDSVALGARAIRNEIVTEGDIDYRQFEMYRMDLLARFAIDRDNYNFDIRRLSFHSLKPYFVLENLTATGHITNKDAEIENMTIETAKSSVRLQAKLECNIFKMPDGNTLESIPLQFELMAEKFEFHEFQQFMPPQIDFLDGNIRLRLFADGSLKKLNLHTISIDAGSSSLQSMGVLENVLHPDEFRMNFEGSRCVLAPELKEQFLPGLKLPDISRYGTIQFAYKFSGSPRVFKTTIDGELPAGKFLVNGDFDFSGDNARYNSNLILNNVNLAKLLNQRGISSNLNATVSIQGTGFTPGNMSAVVQAELDSSSFKEYDIRRTYLVIDVAGDSVHIWTKMNLNQSGIEANCRVLSLDRKPYKYSVQGNVTSFDASEILRDTNFVSDLSFAFDASGSIDSTFTVPEQLSLSFQPSTFKTRPFERGTLSMKLRQINEQETDLELRSDPVDLDIRGTFTLPTLIASFERGFRKYSDAILDQYYDLKPLRPLVASVQPPLTFSSPLFQTEDKPVNIQYRLHIRNFIPVGVFFNLDLRGNMIAQGTIKGSSDSVALDGSLDSRYVSLMLDSTRIRLDSMSLHYYIHPLDTGATVQSMSSSYDFAAARIQVDNNQFIRNKFNVDQYKDYSAFSIRSLFDTTIQIECQSTAQVSEGFCRLGISRLSLKHPAISLENDSLISVIIGSDAAQIDHLKLRGQTETIGIEGFFNPIGISDLQYAIDNFEINTFHLLFGEKTLPGLKDVTGRLNAHGNWRGNLQHPNLNIDIEGDNLRVANVMFGAVEGSADYFEGLLTIRKFRIGSSALNSAGEMLIQGTTPVSPDAAGGNTENDLTVKLNNFRLEFLNPFIQSIKNLTGTFTLDMKVKGTFETPNFQGYGYLHGASMFVEPMQMNFRAQGNLIANGELITLQDFYISNPPADWPRTIPRDSMNIAGSFSLEGYSLGTFDLSANGQLMVMKESAPISGIPLYGDLILNVGSGGLHWRGSLELSSLRADLKSRLANITLPPFRNQAYVRINELPVTFVDDTSNVQTLLRENVSLELPSTVGASSHQPLSQKQEERTFLDNMIQDVNIETQGITQLRFVFNERLNEELLADLKSGRLNYLKDLSKTRVTGEVVLTDRSYYSQFGKRFTASGKLRFIGDLTNPELEVTARYEGVRQVDSTRSQRVAVLITITGNIKEPKPKFALELDGQKDTRSDSEIESDALSYILTGKFRESLTPDEVARVNSTVALGIASSMLAGPLSDFARRTFGVSLDVLYYGGNFQQEADVRLTGSVGDAVVRFGGRVFNDINNANISVQLPMSSVLASSSWQNLILEVESRVEGVEFIDQRRANALRLLYRITF
jgi:hypothetical protein